MTRFGEAEDPRRRVLIRALAAGLFSGSGAGREAIAQALGSRPEPLPQGRSIYRIDGQVLVDGAQATTETRVTGRARVETGANSEVVYAVGTTAYLQRSDSTVTLQSADPDATTVSGVEVITGKILSVFPQGRAVRMTTKNASIGIRGTGVYIESDPEQTYYCTCYGVADVSAIDYPASRETVQSRQHDRPLYIVTGQSSSQNIRPAPFINHTDQELALIEALVGRTPPFVFPRGNYTGPRRRY